MSKYLPSEQLPGDTRMKQEAAQNLVASLSELAENGNSDPIATIIALRNIAATVSDAIALVEPLALEDAMKYGKEGRAAFGLVAKAQQGSARFSYKGIAEWEEQKARLAAIEELAKTAAKLVDRGQQVFDPMTGELVQPAHVSYTKDSLRIEEAKSAK